MRIFLCLFCAFLLSGCGVKSKVKELRLELVNQTEVPIVFWFNAPFEFLKFMEQAPPSTLPPGESRTLSVPLSAGKLKIHVKRSITSDRFIERTFSPSFKRHELIVHSADI